MTSGDHSGLQGAELDLFGVIVVLSVVGRPTAAYYPRPHVEGVIVAQRAYDIAAPGHAVAHCKFWVEVDGIVASGWVGLETCRDDVNGRQESHDPLRKA